MFRPDIVPATGAAVREVLDAAVPTHPAKCVFIVIKKFVIILIMIKNLMNRIIVFMFSIMILAESRTLQRGNFACIYCAFPRFKTVGDTITKLIRKNKIPEQSFKMSSLKLFK